tara:strand:- start:102 stop:704 length:603 start_codon:yes stop_codon:yes gene_type:complete
MTKSFTPDMACASDALVINTPPSLVWNDSDVVVATPDKLFPSSVTVPDVIFVDVSVPIVALVDERSDTPTTVLVEPPVTVIPPDVMMDEESSSTPTILCVEPDVYISMSPDLNLTDLTSAISDMVPPEKVTAPMFAVPFTVSLVLHVTSFVVTFPFIISVPAAPPVVKVELDTVENPVKAAAVAVCEIVPAPTRTVDVLI